MVLENMQEMKIVKEAVKEGRTIEFDIIDRENPKITHRFRLLNDVPLNQSNQDLLVNFIEYWEISDKGVKHFAWITDFTLTRKNAYTIMRGGRARWKIENENNTLLGS